MDLKEAEVKINDNPMKKLVLVFAGSLVSFFALAIDVISGKVVTVIDGNTVEVMAQDNEIYKIMLHGIDCPELGQAYGDKAKLFLEELLLDKSVRVELKGKDRWGTRLGVIVIEGEIDPRFELLNQGLAWTAEVNPIEALEGLKEMARLKGKGLWKENNPTPPWVFRRKQTLMQIKSS
jgi:micrococcal nuclease